MPNPTNSPFIEVYQSWSTERLIHAATIERDQYEPDAQSAMSEEMSNRGISIEDAIRLALPVAKRIEEKPRNSLLFPAKLDRTEYLLRFAILLGLFIFIQFLLSLIPGDKDTIATILTILSIFYKIAGHDLPRIKSTGYNPFCLLFLAVPICNIAMFLFLVLAPPKKQASSSQQTK